MQHSRRARQCARGMSELVQEPRAATLVSARADTLTDGLRKTAHLDTNKEPPMI